jgi:hypothetical protein
MTETTISCLRLNISSRLAEGFFTIDRRQLWLNVAVNWLDTFFDLATRLQNTELVLLYDG